MDMKTYGFKHDEYICDGDYDKIRVMQEYIRYTQIYCYWWTNMKLSFIL